MPAPRWLARFNKRATNRVLGRLVPYLPSFAFVVHRGRKSGREYRTPVNAFRRGDSYTFALTYGPETEWVKNILAAGGCSLKLRGRTVRLTNPHLFHDVQRRAMPRPVRLILGLGHIDDFLSLDLERRSDWSSQGS